eukprot:gene404-437_t
MRLQEEAHHKDLTKNSFTSQTLELQIQKLRQEEAIEHGSNAASVKPVSKRTLARLALQLFGHILPMPTRLVDGRPINHLRSLWLNGEGVLEKREEMRDKKRREREAKVSRELEKARKAATQGEKQRIMELMESGALSGKKGNPSYLQIKRLDEAPHFLVGGHSSHQNSFSSHGTQVFASPGKKPKGPALYNIMTFNVLLLGALLDLYL